MIIKNGYRIKLPRRSVRMLINRTKLSRLKILK